MTLLVIRNLQMCMTIGRRSSPIGALEELDVVRGVGEAAFVTDFGDRHIGRNQQKARMNQALVHKPLVGRCVEVATELLFEGGERAIGLLGEALDRDRLEEVVVDHLLETFARSIYRCEYPTTQTLVALREKEIDKLGHLDILGRLVVRIAVLAQVAVRVEEEVAQRRSSLGNEVGAVATPLAAVLVANRHSVVHVQMHQDPLQPLGRVVEENLLKGLIILRDGLDVVAADA